MANEALYYCRLCCSTNNLISMFKGKSRSIRNSLRKMIQETLQIQIELSDYSSCVCFNCLVDVLNFYNFKLHCAENNEKLKGTQDSFPVAKKFKQSNLPLESIEKPNQSLTQKILEWLQRKRVNLLGSSDISQVFADKDCQTSFECIDASTQCEFESQKSPNKSQTDKDCQTSFQYIDASTQCELESQKSLNISRTFTDKDSQTFFKSIDASTQSELKSPKSSNISRTFTNKDYQTSFNCINASTQYESIEAERRFKRRTKSTQTNTSKYKNSYSQTNLKKLSQEVFVNNVVFKVPTKARSVQTSQEQQCDITGINGCKCSLLLDSLVKNVSLTDSSCQTEAPQVYSQSSQCDLINVKNLIYSPDHFLRDTKMDLKVNCKEEKLSPIESLSLVIPSIPQQDDSHSANFSDLLEVKANKTDCVHICKICDQSLYNRKEIWIHNKSHMKCHFCKANFRSIKFAQNHMKGCKFRRASYVHLTRVDSGQNC